MDKNKFSKFDAVILGCVLIAGLILRLYQINAPLSDAYSWRQADTAAVARNFAKDGFNLLKPHYDDLSSIQSGIDNPQGLRFVEAPIYNAIFAVAYKVLPILPIEVYGRITTIIFSLIIIAILYYLLLKEVSRTASFFGALTYAILPAFVFFSRVVLPETAAVLFVLLSILFLYWWQPQRKAASLLNFTISLICFAISILIKPTVVFYGFALVYLFIIRYKFEVLKKLDFYFYFFLAALPFILWRLYILKYPEGIPSSDWLIAMVNTYEGQKNIFFKPAFFRWVFYERISLMIFGGFLTPFFIAGVLTKLKKPFLHILLISGFIYIFVFQGGNVQHEYYQTILLPPLALFTGIGLGLFLEDRKKFIHPLFVYPLIIFSFVLSFSFSYYYKVKGFYTYPADLNQMAKIIDTFTLPTDKIITDRLGDTTLLYLADRKGAPMLYRTVEQLRDEGYSYYMTDKKEIISQLKIEKKYPVLFENSQFAFFKL